MGKNAIIFHGTGCSPDSSYYWYAWLKRELESRGYAVATPHYPGINREPLDVFLRQVLHDNTFDEDTVLVGHSAGAPLILSILENIDIKVKLSVLVAGYSTQISGSNDRDTILQPSYKWSKIKDHSGDFVFINSVDDPWGCDVRKGRILFDELGGTQVIRRDGHFGSEGNNLPYTEFPLLRDIILETEE